MDQLGALKREDYWFLLKDVMGGKTHHLKEKKNNNSLRENAVLPNHTKLTAIYILYQEGGGKKERERVEQPTFNFLKKSWYVLIIKWKLKKKKKTKLA